MGWPNKCSIFFPISRPPSSGITIRRVSYFIVKTVRYFPKNGFFAIKNENAQRCTLSAGEHKVSRGESRVSRQVALPHNLRAPRSKPKNGLPLFLAAFSRLLSCRHGGATGVIGIGQMLLGKTPPFPGTAEPGSWEYPSVPLPPPSARPIVHGGPFWAPWPARPK